MLDEVRVPQIDLLLEIIREGVEIIHANPKDAKVWREQRAIIKRRMAEILDSIPAPQKG